MKLWLVDSGMPLKIYLSAVLGTKMEVVAYL